MDRKEFWVFKGTSNFCQELELDYNFDSHVKRKPDGFYDIVSTKDTVEGGIHVKEVLAGDLELEEENQKLRAALEAIMNNIGIPEPVWPAQLKNAYEIARNALKK